MRLSDTTFTDPLSSGSRSTRVHPSGRAFASRVRSHATKIPFCRLGIWLHICVSNSYTSAMVTKDAGLRIRVERALRDKFLEACRAEDKPAAQVIREFMREYVAKHQAEAPGSLFAAEPLERNR